MTDWPDDTIPAMSAWLLARIEQIRQHPAAAEIYGEITSATHNARRIIDRAAELVYAGPCDPTGVRCDQHLYARMGAKNTVCRNCKSIHDIADRREWLLAELEEHLAIAEHAGRVLSALGIEMPTATIASWKQRGRLVPHGLDVRGREMFRIGDLIELHAQWRQEIARRGERKSTRRHA